MKIRTLIWLLAAAIVFGAGGCKSEFEKIRASGDTELIYHKALEYYEAEDWQRAQTLFELVLSAFRGRPELEELYFKYAYTYYHLGRYVLANYYFSNFSNTFPNSDKREEADFMAAYSLYQLSPNFRLDQTYTLKAIDAFQLFVNTYPDSPRVPECNRLMDQMRLKLEQKAYDAAQLYFNLRDYQAAIVSFENLLKDFPETNNAERVRYMLVKSAFLMAENSIYEKQEERFRQTLEYANNFLNKYRDSAYANEVREIAARAESMLKQFANDGYQK